MELPYHETAEGYLMPDLTAPQQTTPDIGTWGRRRKRYLKENCPGLYTVMKTEGTLFDHLAEVNRQAEAMWERLVEELAKAQGVDAQMKQRDQMGWVGHMNAIRSQAAETVGHDLIYS